MIKIHITIDGSEHAEVVAHIERGELQVGNVGLTLAEAKSVLVSVQKALVAQQTSVWVAAPAVREVRHGAAPEGPPRDRPAYRLRQVEYQESTALPVRLRTRGARDFLAVG